MTKPYKTIDKTIRKQKYIKKIAKTKKQIRKQ